jgi:hypothetical protein
MLFSFCSTVYLIPLTPDEFGFVISSKFFFFGQQTLHITSKSLIFAGKAVRIPLVGITDSSL